MGSGRRLSQQEKDEFLGAPTSPVLSQPLGGPAASGDQIGNGPMRIGLVVPLTNGGSAPSVVGTSVRNAAELAVAESGSKDISVLVKDDQSSPAGARPPPSRPGNARNSSSDRFSRRRAGRRSHRASRRQAGHRLFDRTGRPRAASICSRSWSNLCRRTVDFAASRGKDRRRARPARMITDTWRGGVPAGRGAARCAREAARALQARRRERGGAEDRRAMARRSIPCSFPSRRKPWPAVSTQLQASGIDRANAILGTGLWNDARVLKLPALQGAWFAAPENGGFNAIRRTLSRQFGSDPTRIATLAYEPRCSRRLWRAARARSDIRIAC